MRGPGTYNYASLPPSRQRPPEARLPGKFLLDTLLCASNPLHTEGPHWRG